MWKVKHPFVFMKGWKMCKVIPQWMSVLLDNGFIAVRKLKDKYIFQPIRNTNGCFTFRIQEFDYRTSSNTSIDVSHFARECSVAICWLSKLLLQGIGEECLYEIQIFHKTNLFKQKKNRRHYLLTDPRISNKFFILWPSRFMMFTKLSLFTFLQKIKTEWHP